VLRDSCPTGRGLVRTHGLRRLSTGTGTCCNRALQVAIPVPDGSSCEALTVASRSLPSTLDLLLSWQSLRGLSLQQRRSAQHGRIGAGAQTRGESNPALDAASRHSDRHSGDPAPARSPGVIVINVQTL